MSVVKAMFQETWAATYVIYTEGEMIANKAIQETVVIVQVRRYEGLDIEEEGTDSQEESHGTKQLIGLRNKSEGKSQVTSPKRKLYENLSHSIGDFLTYVRSK